MQEEFNAFLETVSDKPETRMAFLLLYWTGMRIGELLDIYIRHDFGHVKSGRQTSFSSCIQILLFWESSLIHNAEFAVDLSPVPNAHSPFFSSFESCQIQGFQERCITWKYASLTVELTVGRIQTFNYIGHVNNLSDIR
mgnify:CR=1 FL=1